MKKRLAQTSASNGSNKRRNTGSSSTSSATALPTAKLPAMEEAQIEQLRASFRGQRAAITALKHKLRTEHKQRSLAEASLSIITRYWDQLEQLLQNVTNTPDVPSSKAFTSALESVHSILDADVTYRRNRTIRIDTLLDAPYNAADDDDDDDDDDDTTPVDKASYKLLSEAVESTVTDKLKWAKTAVATLLGKSSKKGTKADILDTNTMHVKLTALANTTLLLERQLLTTATQLDEQTYLNESLTRRLEVKREQETNNNNSSNQSKSGKNASGSSNSRSSSSSSSSSSNDGSNGNNDMNGDVKKQFDELTSKMEEKTSQLKTAEELSKARLIEVEELLKIKKELSANVAKYESGDIPQDILERATLYVKVKRDYDDNRRQLLAMSTNDTTMRESTEKIRKKHFQLEKEMNMSMHKLKGTYEETVKSLMKETQSYCAYADELKVKLAAQTRQTSRILEAEKREVEMQKMIENQREELDRISKRTVGENDQDEVKQLSNEIEQLGEAFGKTEKQNVDLLKQLKRLKKERVGVSNEKDKLKQTLSLSKQSNSVLKDEARLSRRAEEMATSYAKQQESKLKSIQDKLNTLNEEKQMLEREVGQFRAAEVGSVNQDGAFAGIQQLNSAKTKEITDLKSNVEDFKHKIKRLTETNVTIQRDLDRKNRQIQQAQGDIGKMKVTELKELYGEMETCLKCPVVPTRWKNCIITKCGHMFADESLKEQLEKRNRKCPTCNLKYDKQEIMSISLYSA